MGGLSKMYEENLEIVSGRLSDSNEDMYIAYSFYTSKKSNYEIYLEIKSDSIKKSDVKKEKRKTKIIVCQRCEKSFEFTGGEQKYYEEHGLCTPKNCSHCRKIKRYYGY